MEVYSTRGKGMIAAGAVLMFLGLFGGQGSVLGFGLVLFGIGKFVRWLHKI